MAEAGFAIVVTTPRGLAPPRGIIFNLNDEGVPGSEEADADDELRAPPDLSR